MKELGEPDWDNHPDDEGNHPEREGWGITEGAITAVQVCLGCNRETAISKLIELHEQREEGAMITVLTIEKKKHEWLVSRERNVSVCAGVENGAVESVKIVGLPPNQVTYTDLETIRQLWNALTPLLQEIRAAEERTKPKEDAC